MNWQQLKDFANTLTAEQLQQEVKGWDDLRTAEIVCVEITEEERYWNGFAYVSESDCEGYPQYLDKTKVLPIGTIRLNLY